MPFTHSHVCFSAHSTRIPYVHLNFTLKLSCNLINENKDIEQRSTRCTYNHLCVDVFLTAARRQNLSVLVGLLDSKHLAANYCLFLYTAISCYFNSFAGLTIDHQGILLNFEIYIYITDFI